MPDNVDEDAKIFHQSGEKLDMNGNLQRVPWDEERAMLLTLRPNGPEDGDGGRGGRGGGDPVTPNAQPDGAGGSNSASPGGSANAGNVTQLHSASEDSQSTPARAESASSVPFAQMNSDDLRGILDTASDGVVVLDRDGNICALNRSAEALFDVESSDVVGTSFHKLLAPESHSVVADYLAGLGGTGVASLMNDGREIIGATTKGGYLPLFMTVGQMTNQDLLCAVLKDITQWKRAEEELLSAKKLAENASSQKTDFLATISHEIRNPLNAIIGFSDMMIEEKFGRIDNERYRGYLLDIQRSGNHVLELVNDLLDISKIEAGEMELEFEACDLNVIVSECVALNQPQANKERVIIRTSLSSKVPRIVADQRSLRQVILNLVNNALKFTPQGGQVIVSTAYDEQGEVVLRVRDTGVGMSLEGQERALRPFSQINSNRQEGTGLGLPLTKAMVEANRAKFHMESKPDEGTTIEIFFPSQRVLAER